MQKQSIHILYVVAAGSAVVLLLFAFIYTRLHPKSPATSGGLYSNIATQNDYRRSNTPYDVLMQKNSLFAAADTQMKLGNPAAAIPLYQQSLALATDKVQVDQIKFKIAYATRLSGGNLDAIKMFQAIMEDTGTTKIMRAYAGQQLGLMLRENSSRYRAAIFDTPSLASLVVPDDNDVTQRQLFEYVIGLYPLALSELYVADWYSGTLEHAYRRGTPVITDEQKKQYLENVAQRISLAEENMKTLADDPNVAAFIPQSLALESTIQRSLVVIGASEPSVAENLFKRTLAVYATLPGVPQDGLVRFQYARFLLEVYKDARISDIHDILSPLYTDRRYVGTLAMQYFAKERDNLAGRKKNLAALAAVDSQFKQVLVSTGWTDADFK